MIVEKFTQTRVIKKTLHNLTTYVLCKKNSPNKNKQIYDSKKYILEHFKQVMM